MPSLSLAFASCVLCLTSFADYQAILSEAAEAEQRQNRYTLSVIAATTNDVLHSIDLGVADAPPSGTMNHSGTRMWVNVKPEGEQTWYLIGIDTISGREIARFTIGERRRLLAPRYFWSEETSDGKHVMALRRQRGRWSLDTYRLEENQLVASVPLSKGELQIAAFTTKNGERVLSRNAGSAGPVILANPLTGDVVWRTRQRSKLRRFARSASGRHLYVIEGKNISGLAKREGARHKEMVAGTSYTIRVVRSRDGSEQGQFEVGYQLTDFYSHPDNAAQYAISYGSLLRDGSQLWRIDEADVSLVREHDAKCYPRGVIVDERAGIGTALCGFHIEHGRLQQESPIERISTGIDAVSGMYNASRNEIYLESRRDSVVAKFSFDPLRKIGASRSGRNSVKAGRALATVGIAAATYTSGIALVASPNFARKSMALSNDQSKVYVLNYTTRDVTTIDNKTFGRTAVHSAGRRLRDIVAFPNSPYVFSIANDCLLAFDAKHDEPALDLRGGQVVGIDQNLERAYFANQEGLSIYALRSLERIATLPSLSGAYRVLKRAENRR